MIPLRNTAVEHSWTASAKSVVHATLLNNVRYNQIHDLISFLSPYYTVITANPIEPLSSPAKTKRGEARRQMLIQAASDVFMESGYAGASVNEIVRRAGGSLSTLYSLFGNKLGLFEAMIEQKTEEIFAPFENDSGWPDDIADSLRKYGQNIQQRILQKDAASIFRLVVSEQSEDKEKVQQIFYNAGPKRGQRILAKYLQTQVDKGNLRPINCEAAASQFIEMTRAPFFYSYLFGKKPSKNEQKIALEQAIDLFLNGASAR